MPVAKKKTVKKKAVKKKVSKKKAAKKKKEPKVCKFCQISIKSFLNAFGL